MCMAIWRHRKSAGGHSAFQVTWNSVPVHAQKRSRSANASCTGTQNGHTARLALQFTSKMQTGNHSVDDQERFSPQPGTQYHLCGE